MSLINRVAVDTADEFNYQTMRSVNGSRDPQTSFLGDVARGMIWDPSLIGETIKMNALVPGLGSGAMSLPGMYLHKYLPARLKPLTGPLLGGHFDLGLSGADAAYLARQAGMSKAEIRAGMGLARGRVGRVFDKMSEMMIEKKVLQSNRLAGKVVMQTLEKQGFRAAADLTLKNGSRIGAMRVGGSIALHLAGDVGMAMWAYDGLRATRFLMNAIDNYGTQLRKPVQSNVGGPVFDSDTLATERRRALQAISQSRMNARCAFGHEARRCHL